MIRLKPHGIEPGKSGEVITTLADGTPGWQTPAGGGSSVDFDIRYAALDVNDYVGLSDAAVRLTLPAPTSGSQATHPSVLHFPEGWNGWRYWMAFTPYTGGSNATEDPCVVASQDGITWETPDGMTNPLDDAPGGGQYNSDTELVMSLDGLTLYCIWRQHNDGAVGAEEILYLRSTTNGVEWTPRQTILTANKNTEQLASPAVLHDGTQWVMWTVDNVANPNVLKRRTAASITGPWSAATACTVSGRPADRDLWHLAVRKLGGQYVSLLNDATLGVSGGDGELYLMSSTDGLNWTLGDAPLFSQALTGEYTALYRGTFLPVFDNGRLEFDVWHGAWASSPIVWGIYYRRLSQTGDGHGLVVQDEGVSVATAVTALDFIGATVEAAQDGEKVTVTVTAASSSGSGEVLMQDGATGPPVPLENEDGDDWLYEG